MRLDQAGQDEAAAGVELVSGPRVEQAEARDAAPADEHPTVRNRRLVGGGPDAGVVDQQLVRRA